MRIWFNSFLNTMECTRGIPLQRLKYHRGKLPFCALTTNFSRFRAKLTPVHIVTIFGQEEVRKGSPPSVDITVLNRAGKKSLTKIKGLSYYGVNEQLLVSDFSRKFATTCTLHNIQEGRVHRHILPYLLTPLEKLEWSLGARRFACQSGELLHRILKSTA
jgi:translation initiation factor 1 (eIF-1/SUI1)